MLSKFVEKLIFVKYYRFVKQEKFIVCLQCVYSILVDCDWFYLLSSYEQGSFFGFVCDWYMDVFFQGLF